MSQDTFDSDITLPDAGDTEPALSKDHIDAKLDFVRTTQVAAIIEINEFDLRLRTEVPSLFGDHHLRYGENKDITLIESDWNLRKSILKANLMSFIHRSNIFVEFCAQFGSEGRIYDTDEVFQSLSTAYNDFAIIFNGITAAFDTTNQIFSIGNSLESSFETARDKFTVLNLSLRSLCIKLTESINPNLEQSEVIRSQLLELVTIGEDAVNNATNLNVKLDKVKLAEA